MATLVGTMFPPVISTFFPAFVNTTDARVYFSISPYNEVSDIKRIHISVVSQKSNENALSSPSGIIIQEGLRFDPESGMYLAVIPVAKLTEGKQFNINQFYKIQIRFDSYPNMAPTEESKITTYLLENQEYFSEWSSVALIRPILQPSIGLRIFDTKDASQEVIAFNKGIIPISGKVFFGTDESQETETETLQSYKIQISPTDNLGKVVFETPTIYTGDNIDPNDINYKLDLQGLDTTTTTHFTFRILITTKNQYQMSRSYKFQIADFMEEESFDPVITVKMDNENGIANLNILNVKTVFGTLYVKRASSIDNYKTWEDIGTYKIKGPIDLTIEDRTVGSLVWYKYSVQLENSKGLLTPVYRSQDFLPEFYDVIISDKDRQIRLLYNYNVSAFKPIVNRSKIDTLGGRYPRFVENAVLDYKQFSIGGTITAEMDCYEKFMGKKDFFQDNLPKYEVYKKDFGVSEIVRNDVPDYATVKHDKLSYLTTTRNDWLWEREFREKLVEWLNNGEPKLYRSMSEGIMVVMLTDFSLTPNRTLSRSIWDFTATVYEVADGTSLNRLSELDLADIPTIEQSGGNGGGTVDPEPEYVEVIKAGQLYEESTPNKKNNILSSILMPKLEERYGGVLSSKRPRDLYLKDVKIFFHNPPHLFIQTDEGLLLVNDPGSSIWTDEQRARMTMGYTFEVMTSNSVRSTMIFVNEKGYYQLPSDLNIIGLFFPQPGDKVTLEYIMTYKEMNNTDTIISSSNIEKTVVGQESGIYMPNQYLGERIRAKYNFVNTGEFYQKMNFWKGICLDVSPFAVVKIQYYKDDEPKEYVVGETGVYHMLQDMKVQDLCFIGRRMSQAGKERQGYLEEWEYVLDTSVEEEGYDNPNWYLIKDKQDTKAEVAVYQDDYKYPEMHSSWEEVGVNVDDSGTVIDFSVVKNPQYNTVYRVAGNNYIYYIDGAWYPINLNKTNGTAIAEVPVEGMINYFGDVMKATYG